MRNIEYKYRVGDMVVLKPRHAICVDICPDGSLIKIYRVKIAERRDYNGPAYRFEGVYGFFKEACINDECITFDDDEDSPF